MLKIELSTTFTKTSKASLASQRVKEKKNNSSDHNMLQQAHTKMFRIQVCHVISSKYSYKNNIQWLSIYIKELSQSTTSNAGKLINGRTKNTEQENDLGNDRGRDSVAPQIHFLFFLSSLKSLHF